MTDNIKLIFGVLGLVVGIIIGFTTANSLNRIQAQLPSTEVSATPSMGSNLPPDHPPFGTSNSEPQSESLPQFAQAIEKARKSPSDYESQMTAGDLYYQVQNFDEAAKFYRNANKVLPSELEPLIKLGNSYFDKKMFADAEMWYSQALQKKPDDLNVRNDYALTFFLRTPRDIDRAIKEYNKTLEFDPNHELSLQNLLIAYEEINEIPNFTKTLAALKKVNPNNPALKKLEPKPTLQ